MPVGRRLVRTLLFSFVLLAAPLRADSVWTIPGIVNASGLNGTHFVSDLTLTNPGSAPANVTLSFFPSGSGAKTLALAPGQTIVSSDVVASLFASPGAAGALSIGSDQPLLIRAKTYNTGASGTYGVALPVVTSDRLLAPGDVGDSLWISQDASGSAGFRTNVAVVFPDASGGAATVTVYDADGNARGSQTFSLNAPGLQQFSVGSFAGAVAAGRAQIAVTRGHAAGYAVVVDNVTGDSSLFAFEDLPGGTQDVLVNGVARASGRNGAFFRTDGRFYNPTDTDATVTVAFHANANANPSPATASFVVPAGKIRDVVDVLDSLLALPVGSAGALRFQSNWPVAILCRTSNVDPSGARPGTFGAQQKPVPLLSFLNSADAGAAVTGIRQNPGFRTNVGFAAGADGAAYSLTLATADGTTVATTSASLGAFGWTQPGIQDLFPTTTIPENATLTVKVTAGSVDVFDSSIDNLSGDPVVTPSAPLPVSIPSSATIGPLGGSIQSDDGRMTLRIPAGALASSASVSFVTEASNDAPQGTGPSYMLSPGGLAFAKPATLVLRYGSDDLSGSAAGELGIAFENGNTWYVMTRGSVNAAARTLTVPIGSTTTPAAATARSTLADPPSARLGEYFKLTAFNGIQIFPKWAAILTGKQMPLLVVDVGNSSSKWDIMISDQLGINPNSRSPLGPFDTSQITYAWDLNYGMPLDILDGSLDASNNAAIYYAPLCAPMHNPAIIRVELRIKSDPIARYSKTLFCKVRVLPRYWTASATWIMDWTKCEGSQVIKDHVVYKGGFNFSLDDQLDMTGATPVSATLELGNVDGCPRYQIQSVVRTAVPDFKMDLVSGYYSEVFGFSVTTNVSFPAQCGFSFEEFDGLNWVANTQKPLVLVQRYDMDLKEGPNADLVWGGPVLTLTVDLKAVEGIYCQ